MSFLYPSFLFALFAVLIPIIIHLFNFRTYKTVYFSNVKFLKDIKQETKSKSTLKHLLVLLMRILTISALVFAFAQPYIPNKNTNKTENQKQIAIYIDNSFSTEAESSFGKISELAKKKAIEIANAYPENTKFFFLTNDFEQKHQHFVSKEQVKEFIQDTKTSAVVKPISKLISKITDFFNTNNLKDKTNKVYIISDFQKISNNFQELKNDRNLNVILIPLKAENTNNLFIDSVWFETPNRQISQTDEISVKIINKSTESYNEIPLTLTLNDTIKATGSFNINANETIIKKINFTNNKTGIINGKIDITDFPITYDNTFYFNFNISKSTNILIISNKQKNKYIENIFTNAKGVKITYKTASTTNFENLSDYNLIITDELQNLTPKFIQYIYSYILEGGTYICFPNIKINIQSYNKLFNKLKLNYITGIDTSKTYAGKINYNAEIFKNVFKKKEHNLDLPYILERVKFSNQTFTNEEVILYSEKNDKLISSANFGSGKVYIFSQAANKKAGNLVLHPIWAPMLYNMAFYKNNTDQICYTIGNENVISVSSKSKKEDNTIHIINSNLNFDIIAQIFIEDNSKIKIFIDNNIKRAEHYKVASNNEILRGISFNYNRKESDLIHFTKKEIKELINKLSLTNYSVLEVKNELFAKTIKEQSVGKQLWKWFIVFALIFILAEILIIRFMKNN